MGAQYIPPESTEMAVNWWALGFLAWIVMAMLGLAFFYGAGGVDRDE